MKLMLRTLMTFVLQIVIAFFSIYSCQLYSQEVDIEKQKVFKITTASSDTPKEWYLANTVRWKGHEYNIEAGIGILMEVIRHPEKHTRPWNAATAIGELANLGTLLKERPFINELTNLYDGSDVLMKSAMLTCFLTSSDPRGIPVFNRTLDNHQDIKLRLYAARGLVQWNIRRGVAELVDLVDSKEMLPPPAGRLPYVRDNALQTFRSKNTHKSWGFPEEKIRNSIYNRADLDDDQKRTKYNEDVRIEIKKWFVKNEHRFPEWNIGDPLPKVEQKDKSD